MFLIVIDLTKSLYDTAWSYFLYFVGFQIDGISFLLILSTPSLYNMIMQSQQEKQISIFI